MLNDVLLLESAGFKTDAPGSDLSHDHRISIKSTARQGGRSIGLEPSVRLELLVRNSLLTLGGLQHLGQFFVQLGGANVVADDFA